MKKESFLKTLGKNLLKWSPLLLLGLGGAWVLTTEIPAIATGVEGVLSTVSSWGAEGGLLENVCAGLLEPITAKVLVIGSAAVYGVGVLWSTIRGRKEQQEAELAVVSGGKKRNLSRQENEEMKKDTSVCSKNRL